MLTPLAILFAVLGAAWGFAADRIAQRWPAHVHEHVHAHEGDDADAEHDHDHERGDEPIPGKAWAHEHPHEHRAGLPHGIVAPRGVGWRTAVAAGVGAIALGAMPLRFTEPAHVALMAAYAAALVLLLAVDLDQRLLPDLLTLPMAGVGLAAALIGIGPFVDPGALPLTIAVTAILPLALYAFSIPFARGAFGLGDVKLLLSVGLLLGALRLVYAVVVGVFVAGAVIAALLALRRITLKSFIPYGPFLVIGTLWAVLVVR